jgi:diguanylate cyclase (GGDEF)-like protein
MKKLTNWLKLWFFPKTDKEIEYEIDTLNINNIYYLSITLGIIQTLTLIVYIIIGAASGKGFSSIPFISIGSSILLCLTAFIITSKLLVKPDTIRDNAKRVRVFIGGCAIVLIIWGIAVSIRHYINHQQLLLFYTVELLAVLFVKLKPVFSTALIISSFLINYLILNFGYAEGQINPYNYTMLALLSAAGGIINYNLTANYIKQKNRANRLNDSLEIIANHDSTTRLQNRYALNQRIPEYIDRSVCVAMGDIDSFKAVNDTYGHQTGDDVLKMFSDILIDTFPEDQIYRYGGDEFLIICPDSDYSSFIKKLDDINERFSKVTIHGTDHSLGCSFGCVTARADNPADFFNSVMEADKKLYESKSKLKKAR